MCYTYQALTLFFSLLLLPPFFAQAQMEPTFTTPSITINPNFNNSPNINTKIHPVMYHHNHVAVQQIHNLTLTLYDKITKTITKDNCIHAKQLIKQLLWQSRYALAGGTLTGAYSSISLLLWLDYRFLNNHSLWSHWKHDYSFADLCEIPAKQLATTLLHDIAKINCNRKNPTDTVHPLFQFINAIDTEIYRLKRYIAIASQIKKLRLMSVFPTNDVKIEKAKQVLERAHFVRHIFLSWLAEYNFSSID